MEIKSASGFTKVTPENCSAVVFGGASAMLEYCNMVNKKREEHINTEQDWIDYGIEDVSKPVKELCKWLNKEGVEYEYDRFDNCEYISFSVNIAFDEDGFRVDVDTESMYNDSFEEIYDTVMFAKRIKDFITTIPYLGKYIPTRYVKMKPIDRSYEKINKKERYVNDYLRSL